MNPVVHLVLEGDGAFKDLAAHPERVIYHGSEFTLAALANGMVSGKPSLMLRIDLADRRVVLLETSLAAWLTATVALEAKFPEHVAEYRRPPMGLDDDDRRILAAVEAFRRARAARDERGPNIPRVDYIQLASQVGVRASELMRVAQSRGPKT